MDLAQLRYFCDVAATEHMTRSAQRLNIVQPALSRSIHRLEAELGVTLFERTGRNIRLTPEGAFLHARVAAALDQLDAAIDGLQEFSAEQSRIIRVAVLSASTIAVEAIAAFAETHPQYTFELTQSEDGGRWDVRLDTHLPGAPSGNIGSPAHETRFTEAIGIAVPRKSPIPSPAPLNVLAGERFICLAGSRRFRALCDALCRQRGFSPAIGFDSDSPAVVKKMIGLGLGVGFWPERSWGSLEESGARWMPLAEEGFERTLVITLAAHAHPESPADEFYRFLTESLAAAWQQQDRILQTLHTESGAGDPPADA